MSEKTIKQLDTQEMIERIHKDEKSSFSVFLSLELKERYINRPVEEAHLGFDQWRKLLMLREDKKDEIQKLQEFHESRKRWEARQKERVKLNAKKTAEVYKDVIIPSWMKASTTKRLLSLRWAFDYDDEIDKQALYAELATREHVPNKADSKKLRREAAKRKT